MTTTLAEIATTIRDLYAELVTEPGDWVSLVRLRNAIGETVNRHDMDDALRMLAAEPGGDVNIVPESNQRMLTWADVDSAVVIGCQDNHLISIRP